MVRSAGEASPARVLAVAVVAVEAADRRVLRQFPSAKAAYARLVE
jgi:hypothetical protein